MCGKTIFFTSIILLICKETTCKTPNYLKICKSSDPKISQCISTSIMDLLPKLKHGIRELDVPPIEPLHLDNVQISNGVHSNLTDLNVYGLTDLQITEFRRVGAENKFTFKSLAQKLTFEGNYDLDMNIVFIPIKGRGRIHGTLNNLEANGVLVGKKLWRQHKQYLHFQSVQLQMHIRGAAHVQLDDLFNGDRFLGDITNSVINANINVIMDDVLPTLAKSLADQLTRIANKIMDRFPYEELFPR